MTDTPAHIQELIGKTRDALNGNWHELEQKARSLTDLRQQVQRHPTATMLLAFAGAWAMGRALRPARRRARP